MTAVVGILNKNGVAIAAVSAITVTLPGSNQSKIYNNANKLFMLSKYEPLAFPFMA